MQTLFSRRAAAALSLIFALVSAGSPALLAQSRRQPPTQPEKKNKRPGEQQSDEQKKKEEEPPPGEVLVVPQTEVEKVSTNLVNVDAVVIHKKSKQLIPNLKKANFAVFEDGVQQVITNFSTPEAKLNVAVVIEFSKWSEIFGYYGSSGHDFGTREVIAPAAAFMQDAVARGDYISVIAFDMRPTTLTDFTNDPGRINQVISFLLRQTPAFRENNLFDAIKFTLVGGKGDPIAMDNSNANSAEYAGLTSVQGRRRAVILIASGWDTFSKINYDAARKIAQSAGIPIYIIGTGNIFYKKYGDQLPATTSLTGMPGRMDFLQAMNALQTFAKDTGGMYFPVTFEGELPTTVSTINAVLRSQYSLGYNPGDRRDGKKHKILVKVDVNGDGVYDDKEFEINHRQFYIAPAPTDAKADAKS
ncbi:MAG TPA: VWA domain-containing protein [Pyrinomonadaceae bacterium]|jgi:VWFA-related protein|nr:VWA domain-containing protein [Pyrinomonadaceae bacterium]